MALVRNLVAFNAPAGSTSNQTISHGLGQTPKCIVFIVGVEDYGSEDEGIFHDAATAGLGIGATDGTFSFAVANGVNFDTTDVDATRGFDDDFCIMTMNGAGTVEASASFVSWNSSTFTIDWFHPAQDDMTILAMVIGGSGVECRVSRQLTGTSVSSKTFSLSGETWTPKGGMIVTAGNLQTTDDLDFDAQLGIGFWSENGAGGFHNYAKSYQMEDSTDQMSYAIDDDKSFVMLHPTAGTLFLAGQVTSVGVGSITMSYSNTSTDNNPIGFIVFGGDDLYVSAGSQDSSGPNQNIYPDPPQRPRCIFVAADGHNDIDTIVSTSSKATGMSLGMAMTNNGSLKQGCIMMQREELTSNAELSYYATKNTYFAQIDENSSSSLNFVSDGSLSIDDEPADSPYFHVDESGSIGRWHYLALGEVGEVLVEQSISSTSSSTGSALKLITDSALTGQSLNVGSVQTKTVFESLIDSASSSVGELSTLIFTVVNNTVGSSSTNLGEVSTLTAFVSDVEGYSNNLSTLNKAVNQDIPSGISSSSSALSTNTILYARWSIDNLEARTDYGFPTVWVEISSDQMPAGSFPVGDFFERRLLQMPRLQEVELDSRFGISGFQRVSITADNSDGTFGGISNKIQDSYVRMFFVDEEGTVYKEFNGRVVDWTLSHQVTINVEDIEALAFTQDLPKRTLNDVIEDEKAALTGQEPELTEFTNSVVADDLGKPIPIIFGRAVKVPLLYVKADETQIPPTNESKREYDYVIGEGAGLNNKYFKEVFTVYRDDQALDNFAGLQQGIAQDGGNNSIILDADHERPDGWFKYFWIFITSGAASGDIKFVESYSNNVVTPDSSFSGIVSSGDTYELREWQFFDGSQAEPYPGYAFLRFKKRMGDRGRTEPLYADVNGLQDEVNVVRAVQSILTNNNWGFGLKVNTTSFDAAAELPEITQMKCEGSILNTTSSGDLLRELLGFRDMVLTKIE